MLNIKQLYAYYLEHPNIQTDTRKLQSGDFFFALKGPHFNGNKFAKEALEKGAAFAVVDDSTYQIDERTLLVGNVLETLQALAAFHRNTFKIPFIAITGSNGKTTTKELTHAVLSSTYNTYATAGNLNNHIGIPLTLLSIKKDTEIAIIEMGANHQKEIESYCKIVKPTHGLITNIGKAHLEGFGGIEGVKKGKGELFDFLRYTEGIAFACADFSYFQEMTKGLQEIHWYGINKKLPIHGNVYQRYPYLSIQANYGGKISTHLSGEYNLYNILAATAIGKYFQVSEKDIRASIAQYVPQNARSQIIQSDSNTFILDAYNANPSSMQVAIKDFSERPGKQKILLLGAMLELGEESIEEHQALIDYIQKRDWQKVVLVGGDFKHVKHTFQYFDSVTETQEWFNKQDFQNSAFLIKGSRSMEMEKILE